ncbi:Hsp70 ATPase ssc1, partial [Tulasnella sp. 427]
RIGSGAPVYLAAVLEYLAAEILELAGNAARDNKKARIVPRHLQLAIKNDEELNKLLGHVIISQGGVVPFIQPQLLPSKTAKKVHWIVHKTFHAGLLGNLAVGIIFGTPLSGLLQPDWETTFWLLGYVGLILLVFEGGLHTDLKLFRQNFTLSVTVATTGVAVPIGLTLLLFHVGFHLSIMDGFAAGAALAATSLGTTFAVLESGTARSSEAREGSVSKDIRRTRIGTTLLAAALIDDILGLVLVAVITSIRDPDKGERKSLAEAIARPVGVSVAFFLIIGVDALRQSLVRCLSLLRRQALARMRLDETAVATTLSIISLLALVTAAHYAGASVLLGAWVAGAVLGEMDHIQPGYSLGQSMNPRPVEVEVVPVNDVHQTPAVSPFVSAFEFHVAPIKNRILAPLFFGAVGTAIPFLDLWKPRIIWRGLIYSLLMVIAKMVAGLWIVIWPSKSNRPEATARDGLYRLTSIYPALLLSVAMVSRGEISLLIAQLGHLGDEAYQLTMWATLMCTILGPLFTGLLLKWKRKDCLAGKWE